MNTVFGSPFDILLVRSIKSERVFLIDCLAKLGKEHPIIAGIIGALVGGLFIGLIALFIWWAAFRWRKYGKLFCFKSRARNVQETAQLPKPIDEYKRAITQNVEAGLQPERAKPNDKPPIGAGAKHGVSDVEEERIEGPKT